MARDRSAPRPYGEAALSTADVMHCESIAERSALHSWEISAHRHAALLQVFCIDAGRVEAALDGTRRTLAGPAVIAVAPLATHAFSWSSDVQGAVFTVREAHVRRLLAGEPALAARLLMTHAEPVAPDSHAALLAAGRALREEYAGVDAPWRTLAVDAALTRLLVAIARALPAEGAAADAAPGRALAHVQRFRALVEQRFREQPAMTAFAEALGMTPTQLNRVCRQVLGQPALAVLHERIALEARRELAYTTLGVKQIAFGLGFRDAAYFTRFFERESGCTPSAWRARADT